MHIPIMEGRYQELLWLMQAHTHTGAPFVGWDGSQFLGVGIADDPGMYYAIPALAKLLQLSLDQSIYLFFYGLLGVAFCSGLLGYFLRYRSLSARITALVGLLALCLISTRMVDVYIAYTASAMAVMPLFLCIAQRQRCDWKVLSFGFFTGIFLNFMHYVRAYAGVAPLLFIIIVLVCFVVWRWQHKMVFLIVLYLGMLVPTIFFTYQFHQYAIFAATNPALAQQKNDKHVFWHNIYAGLGFLDNDKGLHWDDHVGINRAKVVAPEVVYPSQQYEQVIKKETLAIIKGDPLFVLHTIFAKIGMLLYYLLLAANLGLLAAFLRPKPCAIELAFGAALCFNALFGLLAIPVRPYVLGFIAVAGLYAIESIIYAWCQRRPQL